MGEDSERWGRTVRGGCGGRTGGDRSLKRTVRGGEDSEGWGWTVRGGGGTGH